MPIPHRAKRRSMKDPLPALDPQRQQEELNRAARTSGDDGVSSRQHIRRASPSDTCSRGPPACDAPAGRPDSDSSNPRSAASTASGLSAESPTLRRKQRAHELARVGLHLRLNRVAHLGQLGGIDIHHHLVSRARESLRRIAGDHAIQARAQRQQKIGILDRKVCAARREGTGPANKQRMVIGNQIDGQPGRPRPECPAPRPAPETPFPPATTECRCRPAASAAPTGSTRGSSH